MFSCWAYCPLIGRIRRILSMAAFEPTSLVRCWDPPKPGMSPSLSSGSMKVAFSEQTMRSVSRAISKPPPWASPVTIDMMGLLVFLKALSSVKKREGSTPLPAFKRMSLRSAPAQNTVGWLLLRRITLTYGMPSSAGRTNFIS